MSPFRGDTSALIFKAILDAGPTPVVRLNPDVPAKLEDVINKALEKDRSLRYQHASEMRSDLQRLKRDTDTQRTQLPAALKEAAAGPTTRSPSSVPIRRLPAPVKSVATEKSPVWWPLLRLHCSLFCFGSSSIALRPP
jgi:serine/threonine protein kinase